MRPADANRTPGLTPARLRPDIAQALLKLPRFYTQVLHLMNKMNLPPPFSATASYNPQSLKTKRKRPAAAPPGTAAAPAAPAPQKPPAADLSSSESELESEEDQPQQQKVPLVPGRSAPLRSPPASAEVAGGADQRGRL